MSSPATAAIGGDTTEMVADRTYLADADKGRRQ
jgi:hypothetical protein